MLYYAGIALQPIMIFIMLAYLTQAYMASSLIELFEVYRNVFNLQVLQKIFINIEVPVAILNYLHSVVTRNKQIFTVYLMSVLLLHIEWNRSNVDTVVTAQVPDLEIVLSAQLSDFLMHQTQMLVLSVCAQKKALLKD